MLKTAGGGGATGAVSYQGTWNASTNTPTLVSSVGNQGNYYVVNVAGTTNLNGITDWQVGDWAVFNGSIWQKVDNTDAVTSVNGKTGTVVLGVADIAGAVPNTVNVLAGTGLSGGGALTGNVTLTLANTAVTAATYGNASTVAQVTIDAQGRITNAVNVAIQIASGNVTGLGTMATQNANAVVITGGTINSVAHSGGTFANANITSVAATFPNSYLANSTATLGNATITLGSTTTTVGNLSLSNANITSVAATFPNSYLANSTVTLGNATLTLGGTTSTVGNLTLNNVTINSGTFAANVVNVTTTTASTATFATASLPLVPAGYISVNLNGTVVKIPYYAV